MPSLTNTLEEAIHRAIRLANARNHELSTLEHLLLALLDEPDAARVLTACNVNIEELRTVLTKFVDTELEALISDVEGSEAAPSTGFQRVVQRGAIAVQSSGGFEVTGANVLVAVFNERESHAAFFLQEQNMSRYDAVNFLSHGVAKNPEFSEDRAELEEEFTASATSKPQAKLVPIQSESALRFERKRGERLGYARMRPDLERVEREKQQQVLDFLRADAGEFLRDCPESSNSMRIVREKIVRYENALADDYNELNLLLLWKYGNDLRFELRKDQRRTDHPDPDELPLDVEFSERLGRLVAQHNMFSANEPELAGLDGQTLDPAEKTKITSSIDSLQRYIDSVSNAKTIVDEEIPQDLKKLLQEWREGLTGSDRALAIADGSASNLFKEMMREAVTEATEATPKNPPKSLMAGVREGAERAVGATVVTGALAGTGFGFAQYVKANATVLHEVVNGWFGTQHTLHQVIEWLAKYAVF